LNWLRGSVIFLISIRSLGHCAPNPSFTGAQEDAWKTEMKKIEAAGAATLTPTNAECRAFKNNGGLDAVKATFGGGN
jgi:hypothetical protein